MAKLSNRELKKLGIDTLSTGDFLENLADMLCAYPETHAILMQAAEECWGLLYRTKNESPRLSDCEDFE